MKTCTMCGVTYSILQGNFNKYKRSKDGYQSYCRNCAKETAKYYNRKRKEEEVYKPNPQFFGKVRKALEVSNSDTVEVVFYIVETSNNNMYYFSEVICYKGDSLPTTIINGDKYYNYDKANEICNKYLNNLYYIYQKNKSFKIVFREIKGKEIRSNIFKGE